MENVFPLLHAVSDNTAPYGPPAPGPGHATAALIDELPYLYCGQFEGFGPLHLLADDTLGFAFAFELPVVDTLLDGEQLVSDAVAAMLQALAPGMQWQWFLRAHTDIEPSLALYEMQRGSDAAGHLFSEAFCARWRAARHTGFFPDAPEHNFHPRAQSIAIALKSEPLGLGAPRLSQWLAKALPARWNRSLEPLLGRLDSHASARGRAQRFVAACQDILAAAGVHGLQPTAIDGGTLVQWLSDSLFPQRRLHGSAGAAAAGAGLDLGAHADEIRSAVAALGSLDHIDGGGFRSLAAGRTCHHRVVSMLWQPRAVSAGMLNSLSAVRPNLNICLCAAALSPTAALLQLKARALLNARSTHRFNETEMQARSEALAEVERRLFAQGERILELRLQVHITEASAQQAEQAALAVCKHLEALDLEAAVERDIGSSLLLRGCLPFTVYPRSEQKFRRRRRLLSDDAADIHPGGGAWTGIKPDAAAAGGGHPSPIVMYSNPQGEPLFLDPTKADKNPHALVIGQSGSGKSFFVHDYLLHLWRLPDVRLFLISIKADYRKLALLLGRYVDVNLDSDIALNPFGGAPTLENQARWAAALGLMLADEDPSARLTRDAEVALQAAALAAAQRNWDAGRQQSLCETTLEHICLELERAAGLLGRQLTGRLHPYRRGPYRRLFNAPRALARSDRFIFFNLGGILCQPCAALASFCVFGLVDETMNDPTLRAVPKGLIADEVWALVRNAQAAGILERSLKAYRSLGGFALPIVQDPQDLDTPSGRVMLVNTATKIILPMDRAGQADVQRYVRLNERELDIVRNLRLAKRRYSEFFVSIDGMRSAKGLLIPDPLRYAVATTDPVDEYRIEQHYQACGSMLEALRRFAREAPYGLPPAGGAVQAARSVARAADGAQA